MKTMNLNNKNVNGITERRYKMKHIKETVINTKTWKEFVKKFIR